MNNQSGALHSARQAWMWRLITAAALVVTAAMGPLDAVEIRTATTIGHDDLSLEDQNIVVIGTTLTVAGHHRFASLELRDGAILTHPAVADPTVDRIDLEITGSATVGAGTSVSVSGRGYAPGRTHGNARWGDDRNWSGGSHGGYGRDHNGPLCAVYGDWWAPTSLGSGSGSQTWYGEKGRRGGGAVKIKAKYLNLAGSIRADGHHGPTGTHYSNRYVGGGAGGSVWIDAERLVTHAGALVTANGGNSDFSYGSYAGGAGGGGRIAIYWQSGYVGSAEIKALGGWSRHGRVGSPGTLYLRPKNAIFGVVSCADEERGYYRSIPFWFMHRDVSDYTGEKCPVDFYFHDQGRFTIEGNLAAFDWDNDALVCWQEFELSTHPRMADTDLGGIDDGWEVENDFDPTDPADDLADWDDDGLSNAAELASGTSMNNPDYDLDGEEVLVHGSDPLQRDTDHDGIFDADEVTRGLDPSVNDTGVWRMEYSLDHEFELGTLLAVDHEHPGADQLQLSRTEQLFPFVYIPCSGRGTIVRIDIDSGEILGEYWSAPNGRGRNPSRTTVDQLGNVWVGNRSESSGGRGSIVRIGLALGGTRGRKLEDGGFVPDPDGGYLKGPFTYSTAVDRDGDGLIRTSTGLGHVLPWTNAEGADNNGGVTTATDELITVYSRVAGTGARSLAVTEDNNLWVGGLGDRDHELIDSSSGQPVAGSGFNVGAGGYGAVYGLDGVLWSAGLGANLIRYNPSTRQVKQFGNDYGRYGLAIDFSTGNIWHSDQNNSRVIRISPDGRRLGSYYHGRRDSQGLAVDNGNVWVAHSQWANAETIGHLRNDGRFLGNVSLPRLRNRAAGPTGVAVDGNGKVWVSCYKSHAAMRIDPNRGGWSHGYRIGEVDLIVDLNGAGYEAQGSYAYPYNYSDMTGLISSKLFAHHGGKWTVTTDGGQAGRVWTAITWNVLTLDDTRLVLEARASDSASALAGLPWQEYTPGPVSGLVGRYLETRVRFFPDGDLSPVLYDLTVISAPEGGAAPLALAGEVRLDNDPGLPSAVVPPQRVDRGSYDPDGGPVSLRLLPAGPYPVGETLVTLVVTDDELQQATASATVAVFDAEAPVLADLVDIELTTDSGSATASAWRVPRPTASDNVGVAALTAVMPDSLPLGTSTITWRADDAAGNRTERSQRVSVVDREPPQLVPWGPVVAVADASTGTATPALVAPDTSDNVAVVEVWRDGPTAFPLGTTSVTWFATDLADNLGTARQKVIVVAEGATNPAIHLLTPGDGTVFPAGRIQVVCEVVDIDHHALAGVDVLVDGTVVASDEEAPFTITFEPLAAGDHQVMARARFRDERPPLASTGHRITVTP